MTIGLALEVNSAVAQIAGLAASEAAVFVGNLSRLEAAAGLAGPAQELGLAAMANGVGTSYAYGRAKAGFLDAVLQTGNEGWGRIAASYNMAFEGWCAEPVGPVAVRENKWNAPLLSKKDAARYVRERPQLFSARHVPELFEMARGDWAFLRVVRDLAAARRDLAPAIIEGFKGVAMMREGGYSYLIDFAVHSPEYAPQLFPAAIAAMATINNVDSAAYSIVCLRRRSPKLAAEFCLLLDKMVESGRLSSMVTGMLRRRLPQMAAYCADKREFKNWRDQVFLYMALFQERN